MSIEGYILDCYNIKAVDSVLEYLRSQVNKLLYEYEEDINSLFVKGNAICDNTEIYINNFIDFLENNNMCFIGVWE